MPFEEAEAFYGPTAIPKGMDVTPEPREYNNSVLGAAFRTENPIVSFATSFSYDPLKVIDPDYRPWDDIQGTEFEPYADRFVGAADREDMARMKMQIRAEMDDRAVLDAAGWKGVVASMGASLLSPTTFLPGGAIVRGAKGVSIAKTGLSVGASAAGAAALDEAVLQATQQLRTGQETALSIGGSFIIGGLLGTAVGKLTQMEFKALSAQAEDAVALIHDFNEAVRALDDGNMESLAGAGSVAERPITDADTAAQVLPDTNLAPGGGEPSIRHDGTLSAASAKRGDLTLRGEKIFQAIDRVPILRALVRSDPILRGQLSPLKSARLATAALVETPLEYSVNAQGMSVRAGNRSVEGRIRDRDRSELTGAISVLRKSFSDYWSDGPVGMLGTLTAPMTSRFAHLMGKSEKLQVHEFMEEVGKAMRRGDKHPIPQVQSAAEALRANVFDKVGVDAEDVGLFDSGLSIDNAASYFERVYNTEKITQNFGNGTADDILPVLEREFEKRREKARTMLEQDNTVNELEIDVLRLKEEVQQTRKVLKKATEKARAKRDRASAAIERDGAVGRVSRALREAFEARVAKLSEGRIEGAERQALKEIVADARAVKRLEPPDILAAIRARGGINDPRVGGRWSGKDWKKGAKPTEIETMLGASALTIRRNDGMDIDYMREALVEDGYLPERATVNDLMDAIGRAARGEKIYSDADALELARYEAAMDFQAQMDALGIDVTMPLDEIAIKIGGKANTKRQKAKAEEAGRSADRTLRAEDSAEDGVLKAIDRLQEARERLAYLNEELGPKFRGELRAAGKELAKVQSALKTARKAREKEGFYADASDAEIQDHARNAARSIIGLKPGESHAAVAFASPTMARTLDVPDEVLEPWLESNAEMIVAQYARSMIPQIEMMRTFGDIEGASVIDDMLFETAQEMAAASSAKQRKAIKQEGDARIEDFKGMRDRILGIYGAPANPRNGWVVGGRVARNVSYMGFLGGMTLSAIPDIAGVIGRAGVGGAFGAAATAMMDPKRFFTAAKDMTEMGAAAEWWLNSRHMALSEVMDPYGRGSKMERAIANGTRSFSIMTGMIPWNVGWKSAGGAVAASRIAKAAEATARGAATERQMRLLAANDIEPWMADRIAAQVAAHGDTQGILWLPKGGAWDDAEAFAAFRNAMNREFDLMVITPGQDKPLTFSSEFGKFFSQFKSFGVSAHHRILLAGLQRADADTLAQFTAALLLGGLVSNIKSDLADKPRKEGTAFWEDALDKSGFTGWLMEPYNAMAGLTGGMTSISGEPVSRFQSRSQAMGVLGPSVDMGLDVWDAAGAFARGEHSYRDVRKIMRPIPGNNITYLLPLFQKVEDALVNITQAKPREE